MKPRLFVPRVTALIVLLVVAAAGCSQPAVPSQTALAPTATSAPASAAPEGTLTVGLASLGNEQMVAGLADAYANVIMDSVYESLVTTGPDLKVQPMLAERWEMAPDGKSYTFWLRKGIQYQDGVGELTSADVKYSLERTADERSLQTNASAIRAAIQSIDASDPYKVVINLKEPNWAFISYLNHTGALTGGVGIVSKKYVEQVGDAEASKHPKGTGPWKLVDHQTASSFTFEAVEGHWRQTPAFKKLVVRLVPNEATRLSMLRSGDLDIAELTAAMKPEAKSAGIATRSNPGDSSIFVALQGQLLPTVPTFDQSVPWAADPADKEASARALKVRKALALATDTQAIIDRIYNGEAQPSAVVDYVPGTPQYDPSWKPYPYDLNEAKRLLAEAGYASGFAKPIDLRLVALPGRPELPDIGQAIGMMWEQGLGLKIKYTQMDWNTIRPQMFVRNVPWVAWAVATGTMADPAIALRVSNHSKAAMSSFEYASSDDLIDKISGEMDSDKRLALHRQLGQLLYDNVVAIPIGVKNSLYGVSERVGDWPMVRGQMYSPLVVFEYIRHGQKR